LLVQAFNASSHPSLLILIPVCIFDSLTMQGAFLVLTCLVCTSHARRIQSSSENLKAFMSADVVATSQVDGLAQADQAEHAVFQMESGGKNTTKPSSPALVTKESWIKSLIRSWNLWNSKFSWNTTFAAIEGESDPTTWSGLAWAGKCYWPLSVIACACALIVAICCSSCMRSRRMRKECGPGPQETSCEPRREHTDKKRPEAIWTMGKSSLPVLSNILEAWDATQDKEPATFVIPHDDKLKTGMTKDLDESETPDTADSGDVGEAIESASTVSSIVDDVTPRVIFEPSGISPTLLNYAMAKSLLKFLPAGQRVPGASVWKLSYKPVAHGTSISTLHRMIAGCERTLLLVRDADDHVFGGFAPLPWKVGRRFHGSGEAFVFKFGKLANLAASAEAEEEEEVQDPADPIEVKVFPWTQLNHHFMYASQRLLAMGGGDGQYALAIHEGLLRGHSSPTPTFGNPPLSSVQGGDFVLKDMEVWSLE